MSKPKFSIPVDKTLEAPVDERALSENTAFDLGYDLNAIKTQQYIRRLLRQEAFQDLLSTLTRRFLHFLFWILVASFTVLLYHYIMPDEILFLGQERVQALKDLLLTGTVGGALSILWRSQSSAARDHNEKNA